MLLTVRCRRENEKEDSKFVVGCASGKRQTRGNEKVKRKRTRDSFIYIGLLMTRILLIFTHV
jgi:hypothetical protein